MSDATAFSPDYISARARFRSAALALGARHEVLEIGQTGPDGDVLTIDVAILGAESPKRAVVVSSGLHGIEGFFGSAVQAALLEDVLGGYQPPEDCALVFLHALNPYGFAWLRRVNEDNADLNRNFLREGELYAGSPEGYDELDDLLNPTEPPSALSQLTFLPKAAWNILRLGMPALKNAVAGGQYDYPHGLFFGGSGPSKTQQLLDQHLPRWVGSCRRVVHVDFHTGLGPWGTYKLFVDHDKGSEGEAGLFKAFGEDVVEAWDKSGTSYTIRGGMGTWCKARLPAVQYDVLAAEFGTRNVLQVIAALHDENRAHNWGGPDHPATELAKKKLRDTFAPPERNWRDKVVPAGVQIVMTAMDTAFAESDPSRPDG